MGWLQLGCRGMTAAFTIRGILDRNSKISKEEKLNGWEVNAVSNQQTKLGG